MKQITKIFLASILLILTSTLNDTYAVPLHQGVIWLSYDGDAFTNAKKTSSPVLLFVSASWCNYCQEMLKNTLRDPQVANYIKNNFITVFANTDELAVLERYHITELPALLVLNSYGDVIEQFTGYRDTETTMKILMKARGKVANQQVANQQVTSNVLPREYNNAQNKIGKHVLSLNQSKKSSKHIVAKKTQNTKHVVAQN